MLALFAPLLTLIAVGPPGHRGDALWVPTPGQTPTARDAAVRDLQRHGWGVHRVTWSCEPSSTEDMAIALHKAAAPLGHPVVFAEGLGASIALRADLDASAWVLVGPVVDFWPVHDLQTLAAWDPPAGPITADNVPVEQAEALWRLFGTDPPLSCVSGRLWSEWRDWMANGPAPITLPPLRAPVVLLLGDSDDLAPVEVALPPLRDATQRDGQPLTVYRVGLGALKPADATHSDLTSEDWAVRTLRRAARRVTR